MTPKGVRGNNYIAIFVETYARYIYAYFGTKKTIAAEGLRELNNLVYNQTHRYIGLLVIDGGREFGIKALTNYAKLVGINVLRTAPYTSK